MVHMMEETYECLTGEPSLLKGRRLVREGGAGNVLALTSNALASYLTEKCRSTATRWLATPHQEGRAGKLVAETQGFVAPALSGALCAVLSLQVYYNQMRKREEKLC
jgi:hypothetical protein